MINIIRVVNMPKKAVKQHGTQAGEQIKTEYYKQLQNYKELKL